MTMQVPIIEGVIARRLLVNYRVAPHILAQLLPAPFRPQLVAGFGVAGICLIGMRAMRPRGFPASFGVSSENAAHRVAVEWDEDGVTRCGVYIPRRDTNSRLNAFVGGRIFPGVHQRAHFTICESPDDAIAISLTSVDGETRVDVRGRKSDELPPDSIFESLASASAFFQGGALGYSAGRRSGIHDGLELRTTHWAVMPFKVERVTSSFFDNEEAFPAGSVALDCALLMRDVAHEWHSHGSLVNAYGVTGSPSFHPIFR